MIQPRQIHALAAFAATLTGAAVLRGLAFSGAGQELDRGLLHDFFRLRGAAVVTAANVLVKVASPVAYVFLVALLVAPTLTRREFRPVAAASIIVIGANATTFVAKHVLVAPRPVAFLHHSISAHSWPSGHATAVMSLALCAAAVASPARRRVIAIAFLILALLVGSALLILHWHFPSDVVGGYAIALSWWWFAVACLGGADDRVPAHLRKTRDARGVM